MSEPIEGHLRLECLKLAVQVSLATADKDAASIATLSATFYNHVIGSADKSPSTLHLKSKK